MFKTVGYNKRKRRQKRLETLKKRLQQAFRWCYRRGLLYALALFGLGFGIQQGRNQLPELNPLRWKNLKTIEVKGNDSLLTIGDVLSIAVIDSGMLMDSIDEDLVKERLNSNSNVSSAEVKKEFPSTLKISIVESTPIMSSLDAGTWTVYSEKGKILPASTWTAYSYPVVISETREDKEICAAFLYKMRSIAPDLYEKVSQLRINHAERGIEVFFSDVRFKTLFSVKGDWDERTFMEYKKLLHAHLNDLALAHTLDLRFKNFAYLRNSKKRKA